MLHRMIKAKAAEKGVSVMDISRALGINPVTFYRKTNGTSDFTRKEIIELTKLLTLTPEEVQRIFFTE